MLLFVFDPVPNLSKQSLAGAEDLIMSTFPFSEYKFNVITLERPSANLTDLLVENGYILLKTLKTRTETLWVHQSVQASLDMSALEIDTENFKYREKLGS